MFTSGDSLTHRMSLYSGDFPVAESSDTSHHPAFHNFKTHVTQLFKPVHQLYYFFLLTHTTHDHQVAVTSKRTTLKGEAREYMEPRKEL